MQKNIGEYRLLTRLATGGQSEVFLAARSGPYGFFRPVVIKAIPDHFKGRERLEALFYQEATISSRFSHPHVVTIHDARQVDDEDFMVMDYMQGQTMADLAQRAFSTGEGLTLGEAVLMVIDACRGLEYVHEFEDINQAQYSVVHCDISPQNLMVTYSGLVRVFDFGISQIQGQDGELKSELVGGKFAYMSPEQCLGEVVDPRSDVFSLGIILYELVTGRRLFRRRSREQVIAAITVGEITRPGDVSDRVPPSLDEVIMKALARPKSERYESARQFRNTLESILVELGESVDEVRQGLAQKISELFVEERREIGELLQAAQASLESSPMPKPSKGEAESLEARLGEAKEEIEELATRAQRATEVADRLTEEVTRLQGQRRWFVVAICALSLLAVAIATAMCSGDNPTTEIITEAGAED